MKSKMRNTVLGLAAVAGTAALLPSQALALLPELDRYTINFSDAAEADEPGNTLGLSNIVLVEPGQVRMSDNSFVAFRDIDGSGDISAGDKFADYGVVRLTGVNATGAGDVPMSVASPGYFVNHEATVVFHIRGTQVFTPPVGNGLFTVDEIVKLDVYFDAASDPTNSLADFTLSSISDFDTYADGVLVETAKTLLPSTGDASLPTDPNGNLTLAYTITDLLSGLGAFDPFELDFLLGAGDPVPGAPISTVVNLNDFDIAHRIRTNNGLIVSPNPSLETSFEAFSGFDIADVGTLITTVGPGLPPGFFTGGLLNNGTTIDFGFMSTSGGQLDKFLVNAIPEPVTATMGVMGLGALGLVTRRRRLA